MSIPVNAKVRAAPNFLACLRAARSFMVEQDAASAPGRFEKLQAEVVQRYKSLADIERGFRVLKSDIEIGPVYHRLPKRIRAHALVCFMALILYRVMRTRLKANDRDESPTRLLQQLRRIHQQTVRTADGQALHGLTEMSPAQKSLFTVLQLPIPTPAELSQPVL